jgi:hypothetical protein
VIDDFWRQWQQALGTLPSFAWKPRSSSAQAGAGAPGFGPFAESAERFATAVREFVAKNADAKPSSSAASGSAFAAAEELGNFLREHFAAAFKPPWSSSTSPSPESAFTEAPALGLGREQVLRAQRTLAAWNRLTAAQGRLSLMWTDTLREAAAGFTSRLQREPGEPLTAEAMDRLYDLWIDCAEEAYGRTAHSEGFCAALAECVNAGSEWRRETAAGVEEWAKLSDLPTRSEINALTLRLRELEVQLAAAQKEPRSAPARARRPQAQTPAQSTKAPRSKKPRRSAKPARPAKPGPRRSKRRP